ncbi:MAG TPA: hypothetical protein VIV54_21005 [Burkholderiales bacterium]
MSALCHLAKALPDLLSAGLLYALWTCSVALWLGTVFVTLTWDVPELGATAALRAAAGFNGNAVWESEPQRALAAGVLYFGVMGLLRPLLAWAFSPPAGRAGMPA